MALSSGYCSISILKPGLFYVYFVFEWKEGCCHNLNFLMTPRTADMERMGLLHPSYLFLSPQIVRMNISSIHRKSLLCQSSEE